MRTKALILIAAVFSMTVLMVGCRDSKPEKSRMSQVDTNVESLGRLIHFPHKPVRVLWSRVLLGKPSSFGPTDWALTAVITFEPADATAIVASTKLASSKSNPEIEDWFPDDIKKGLQSKFILYDASAFYKPPLLHGRLIRIEGTPSFVLKLFTM